MLAVSGALEACAPVVRPGAATDANGLILPPGFTSRIIAQGGQVVPGTNHLFPVFPDGAATFPDPSTPGGWLYAVNHEVPLSGGGVSCFRFAPDGTIVDAYAICGGTSLNCAGGATPWGTWLSGEEHEWGVIWECDPTGPGQAQRRGALGTFYHEAAAVAADDRVYLTEDRPDGCLYRFTPDTPGDLASGLLEVMVGGSHAGPVSWAPVPDPNASTTHCRDQVAGALHFDGGEGIATAGTKVWWSTKGDNTIWEYDLGASTLGVRYQGGGSSILSGVDNLWIDRASDTLLVAEDGGDMQVVAIGPDDTAIALVQATGHTSSEITGPTFSPDGQRLYFSSQRGPTTPLGLALGITYEVTGPFDDLLGR
jgi:secreted PhoX family phosphatase